MPNTYTQIHIHAIFAVQNRQSLISNLWKDELYKYITGILQNKGHKMIIINGVSDHVHMLFGLRPSESLSALIQEIKANASKWINEKKICAGKFQWQEGFGAFSYNKSQLPRCIEYIKNQEEHHSRQSFEKEYIQFLENFGVNYDKKYIFHKIV